FQAEDGIRDDLVTGVQTCALPICGAARAPGHRAAEPGIALSRGRAGDVVAPAAERRAVGGVRGWRKEDVRRLGSLPTPCWRSYEIGRASCRERGESEAGEARRTGR